MRMLRPQGLCVERVGEGARRTSTGKIGEGDIHVNPQLLSSRGIHEELGLHISREIERELRKEQPGDDQAADNGHWRRD